MDRKRFIHQASLGLLSIPLMGSLRKLDMLTQGFSNSARMPVLFIGHGSPMNGIEENEFVQGFRQQAKELSKPNAILVVSAHWETKGTWVTAMESPRTIHDFGGFPKALYEVQYPAPGDPAIAREISNLVKPKDRIQLDEKWGLDHGTWTVVKHLYPKADVPVLQLSIDYSLSPDDHYQLGNQLRKLRDKGVLIIGSGNMVHNLRAIAWDKIESPYAFDWAQEANEKMKEWILAGNHKELINYKNQGKAFELAIPTPEHYLPLLYALSLKAEQDDISLFNDKPLAGSLSMTSVRLG